jgi:putative tryptophan/tyrosine transport system substrate-binding protein
MLVTEFRSRRRMQFGELRRREFITLFGCAAAWPVAARAQQAGNVARIGIVPVGSASNTYDASLVEAFRAGIRQAGLDETSLDLVWVKNEAEYAQDIGDLLQRGVRVLVTMGTSASLEAKRQTIAFCRRRRPDRC